MDPNQIKIDSIWKLKDCTDDIKYIVRAIYPDDPCTIAYKTLGVDEATTERSSFEFLQLFREVQVTYGD